MMYLHQDSITYIHYRFFSCLWVISNCLTYLIWGKHNGHSLENSGHLLDTAINNDKLIGSKQLRTRNRRPYHVPNNAMRFFQITKPLSANQQRWNFELTYYFIEPIEVIFIAVTSNHKTVVQTSERDTGVVAVRTDSRVLSSVKQIRPLSTISISEIVFTIPVINNKMCSNKSNAVTTWLLGMQLSFLSLQVFT